MNEQPSKVVLNLIDVCYFCQQFIAVRKDGAVFRLKTKSSGRNRRATKESRADETQDQEIPVTIQNTGKLN